ncbi:MAG TPA: hypothetical protein VFU21_00095 [Kofleriaceae bacterium]|nr:hypothetical protein [Kofleriaceae bacterium]
MKDQQKKTANRKRLELRKQSLRQLDQTDLQQVAGGWDWWRTCMGTWATYYGG